VFPGGFLFCLKIGNKNHEKKISKISQIKGKITRKNTKFIQNRRKNNQGKYKNYLQAGGKTSWKNIKIIIRQTTKSPGKAKHKLPGKIPKLFQCKK